ncbi:hypothetical protein [Enterococcus alishanensis]
MKYLEQITFLGNIAESEDQKEILRKYFSRLKKLLQVQSNNDDKNNAEKVNKLYCSMIRVYIIGFIDKTIDYFSNSPEYYSQIIDRYIQEYQHMAVAE